jgi:hypothetical protein
VEWLEVASKILPFIAFLYTVYYNKKKDKWEKEKSELLHKIQQLEQQLAKEREKRRTSRKGKRR